MHGAYDGLLIKACPIEVAYDSHTCKGVHNIYGYAPVGQATTPSDTPDNVGSPSEAPEQRGQGWGETDWEGDGNTTHARGQSKLGKYLAAWVEVWFVACRSGRAELLGRIAHPQLLQSWAAG